MSSDIDFKSVRPEPLLADFVESFWMLCNVTDYNRDGIVLPDGRIDLFFSQSATEPFHVSMMGLESKAKQVSVAPKTRTFAISFKLLATEYIFGKTVSGLLNDATYLPGDYWDFAAGDLLDFDAFCKKATQKVLSARRGEVDSRKRKLFDLIYSTNGTMTVQALSEQVYWSSRQINRYFTQQYGMSLKAYCSILRFRASFHHIQEGKLFPEERFADQSHFIREIKKLSGVTPKELKQNKNDRFIQFSLPPEK